MTDDAADKSRIWDLFAATPPPLGYDPVVFWEGGKTDPAYALLIAQEHLTHDRAG